MTERDIETVRSRIRARISAGEFRVTQHAHQEMAEETISLDDVVQTLSGGSIIEDYPDHQRGPCALVAGQTSKGRWLHVVCSSDDPIVVVITAYEPQLPKWLTPTRRVVR